MSTFCPQCGFGVQTDEDGCCVYCGATATGDAVDRLIGTTKQRGLSMPEQIIYAKDWTLKIWMPGDSVSNREFMDITVIHKSGQKIQKMNVGYDPSEDFIVSMFVDKEKT